MATKYDCMKYTLHPEPKYRAEGGYFTSLMFLLSLSITVIDAMKKEFYGK